MRWENTVIIDAPADAVWALNVDVERWPSLTPTMQSVQRLEEGPLRLGSTARIKQPGQSAAVWTVTHFLDGREFAWQARRPGMAMVGKHVVEDLGDGRTRNTLSLEMTGFLGRVLGLLGGAAIGRALRLENAGFKDNVGNSGAR